MYLELDDPPADKRLTWGLDFRLQYPADIGPEARCLATHPPFPPSPTNP